MTSSARTSRVKDGEAAGPGPAPFLIRVVAGDITRARSSLVVVNHFNGVNPAGAEAAVDAALGGALSRRAAVGAFDGRFGTSYFVPASTSRLAADGVLVLGLGAPERFLEGRLPELGVSIVEAMATFGYRDVATILHSAGNIGVDPARAASLIVGGVLNALATVPGAECARELSIYEIDGKSIAPILEGVRAASAPSGVHTYVEQAVGEPPSAREESAAGPPPSIVDHLRLCITKAGADVKVAVIGQDAMDVARTHRYPDAFHESLSNRLRDEIILPEKPEDRVRAMRSIGEQLYNSYLEWTDIRLAEKIEAAPSEYLVARVDLLTVDLPWELLHVNGKFVSRSHRFARQLELGSPGRQGAPTAASGPLRVLVIGNPTQDLPGAANEANAVAAMLEEAGAVVTALVGDDQHGISYGEVTALLDRESFAVVHYAGHAKFDELRQDASGLLLADRRLTAGELANRNNLPRLFVANACNSAQTGAGLLNPFEGALETINLVSGLLSAGVRGFVGSAWKVGDVAATTFAKAFYEAILPGGPRGTVAFGEAVRLGREAIVEAHGEAEPAWAAYSLYGSPWRTAF